MSQKFQNTMKLTIPFTGHEQVLSLHEKTLEITKDDSLTPQGDCIVGVNSGISCIDLPEKMKEKIQNPKSKISFTLKVGKFSFKIQGHGSEKLTLKHVSDIVLRKSAFTCSRTIARVFFLKVFWGFIVKKLGRCTVEFYHSTALFFDFHHFN